MSTSASKNNLLIPVLTGVLVFGMAARTPLDSDLFWHLRAGTDMLRSGQPVLVDWMSYTRAGAAWINHSWLSEVFLALIFRAGGFAAIGFWMALMAVAVLMLVYARLSGPAIWRAFLLVLVAAVIAPVWSPRPQLFSLLLLVLLDWLLDGWRAGRAPGWLIVLLMGFWSNLHGGYALGVILIMCWVAGELLNHLTGREGALSWRRILSLAGWGAVGFLAAAINPNGIAMWRIPFQTVGVGVLQQSIPEWASPDFHDLTQQPFLVLLVGLIAAVGLAGKPVDGKALMKSLVFAAMGLVARRNIAPFALLAAPLLAESGGLVLAQVLARLPRLPESKSVSPRLAKGINLFLVGFLAFVMLLKWYVVSTTPVVEAYMAQSYPTAAVSWLKMANPPGKMFSSYAWGGYLDWALPQYPVFVDGRTDLFGDAVIGQWLSTANAEAGWQQTLDHWDVRLVLLERGWPLTAELERVGWKLVYQDSLTVIYGR